MNMTIEEVIRDFWPEASEREVAVRVELETLYKEQSVLGRGLDKYERIAELDAELLRLIAERQ